MRILIVGQYFWPENFRINDLALGLKERGHEVIVFTGKPNYPTGNFFPGYSFFSRAKEYWNGIPIYRTPLITRGGGKGIRLSLNYLSFCFFGSIKALFMPIKADVILVYQLSPITMTLPAFIFKFKLRIRLFLYVQDLWPESVEATTKIKKGILIKILYKISNWIYRNADGLLIQSKAFKAYLIGRKVKTSRISYLPNSTDAFYKKVSANNEFKKYFTGELNLVFAGNIGDAQSFDTLIEAAKIVNSKDKSVIWIIIGEGSRKHEFELVVKNEGLQNNFKFIGAFDSVMMPSFFAHADAMIVSLKKDFIFSLTIPNKIQSYMACGKPIIGSLDGEGQLIIKGADCGLASPAEDYIGLAENILRFKNISRNERLRLGINALHYFTKEFNRENLLDKLEMILEN